MLRLTVLDFIVLGHEQHVTHSCASLGLGAVSSFSRVPLMALNICANSSQIYLMNLTSTPDSRLIYFTDSLTPLFGHPKLTKSKTELLITVPQNTLMDHHSAQNNTLTMVHQAFLVWPLLHLNPSCVTLFLGPSIPNLLASLTCQNYSRHFPIFGWWKHTANNLHQLLLLSGILSLQVFKWLTSSPPPHLCLDISFSMEQHLLLLPH